MAAFEISPDGLAIIHAHAIINRVLPADALGHAIALLEMFDEESAKGSKFLIEDRNGKLRELQL